MIKALKIVIQLAN